MLSFPAAPKDKAMSVSSTVPFCMWRLFSSASPTPSAPNTPGPHEAEDGHFWIDHWLMQLIISFLCWLGVGGASVVKDTVSFRGQRHLKESPLKG